MPEEAKSCLRAILEAKLAERFFEAPLAGGAPCAQETFREDGELSGFSTVDRFSAKEHRLQERRTDPDYADMRSVYTVTETFDRKGRPTKVVAHWQDFTDGTEVADCESFSTTRHRYDAKGQPSRSERRIDTCEGVDAGTVTTRRRFKDHEGWVEAALSIVDRESPEEGRELWIPSPSSPRAHVLCDDSGACSCSVEVLGCDGTVLGRVEAREALSFRRWRWRCPVDPPNIDPR